MKTEAEQYIIDALARIGVTVTSSSIGDVFETSCVIDVETDYPIPETFTLQPEGYKLSYIGDNQFLVS